MIRSLPRSWGSGGSSGCIAITTPDSSATGMISSRKCSRFVQRSGRLAPGSSSAENGGRPGMRACSRSRRQNAVVFAPPRSGASIERADPVGARHEVVADEPDAEAAEVADERLHRVQRRMPSSVPSLIRSIGQVALDGADLHPERPDATPGAGRTRTGLVPDTARRPARRRIARQASGSRRTTG